ncbi:Na+/H+ antiporter NhaC [Enterocloster citroniae]|uniref:Na+/H+ antiporter NhaC n=1 Tax=Enterocloster citroniae TaxID=358743 RepID=UPI001D07A458|nr:Na+/H+ antiporter NhaC [Enterocloster citroniae]MCB7067029.1 Na+/H+ antiporter NhaC [Enterocloster citroniae]
MDIKNQSKIWKATIILILCAMILSFGVYHKIPITALLTLNIFILSLSAYMEKIPLPEIEDAIINGIRRSVPAVIILMCMGILIAEWIMCGTVPMVIYYGLKIVSPAIVLPSIFVLCSVTSMLTGSSWGTAGTIGVACVAIGESMGIPNYILAGAAISGVVLGDKLSPLSDSTILTSSANGVSLYDHVHSMAYTTLPAFFVSAVIFYIIGFQFKENTVDIEALSVVSCAIEKQFQFNLFLLLPIVILVVLGTFKIPALLALLSSGISAMLLAIIFQDATLADTLTAFYSGFVSNSGVGAVDKILSKGGIDSMMSIVSTSVLALGMGGVLEKTGYLHVLVDKLAKRIHSIQATILFTWIFDVLVIMLLSNFYVSVVLVGSMFGEIYDKNGIHRSVMTRTIEEGNTITVPLIPWNVSCAYYMGIFNLTSMNYIPYTIFVFINILFAIIYATFDLCAFRRDKDGKAVWKIRPVNAEEH